LAEIKLRLSKAEADALQQDRRGRKSNARRAGEFKLRQAIWSAYPELREKDLRRAERDAHDDDRHKEFRIKAFGR
jgi:hypothetical protein